MPSALPHAARQTESPKAKEWDQVRRLYKRHPLSEINLCKALYGIARDGARSYICVTFDLDGLGASGPYQNIRSLYPVDRTARPFKAYYTVGDIRNIEK